MSRRPPRTIGTLTSQEGKVFTMREERLPNASYGKPFMTMFPEELMPMAINTDLPRSTFPLLIWAWNNLSHEKFTQFSQVEVAKYMKTSQSSISNGLAALLDMGMIERQGKGVRQAWRLTPKTCWRGYAGQYQQRIREDKQPKISLVKPTTLQVDHAPA
jgi:hypothetical protein